MKSFFKWYKVHKDNQGTIATAVAPQVRPYTKHIGKKYHQL